MSLRGTHLDRESGRLRRSCCHEIASDLAYCRVSMKFLEILPDSKISSVWSMSTQAYLWYRISTSHTHSTGFRKHGKQITLTSRDTNPLGLLGLRQITTDQSTLIKHRVYSRP